VTTSLVPAALSTVVGPVEDRLRTILDAETQRWIAIDPRLAEPFEVLASFVLGGGKRLRPAFCHWAFVGAGGDPTDRMVIDAGAAFEFLHAFALMHDDVMDGSTTRRNGPTVHTTFDAIHVDNDWNGESRRFGEGVAILIGDLAEVFADRLMTPAPSDAFGVWNELKIELNIGQFLDVTGAATGDVDLDAARRIVRYKSGKYTIERPLHLGAALAGRFAELEDVFTAYGNPLGDAFQMRDDILGTFGDSSVTGKPVGDDLREGKPTPLLALATQRATPAQADVLARVGSPDLSLDEIDAIRTVLIDTRAVADIDMGIDELIGVAIDAIGSAPISGEAIDALRDLAHYVGAREF